MTVRKAPSYAGFRTVALQILALLAGLRAVILVVFIPLQPSVLNTVMAVISACLLLVFLVSLARRRVSAWGGIAILWLALASAVLGGVGLHPAELGDISVFTTMSLVLVAAAVLEMRAAVTFTVVAMVVGAVSIGIRSDLPMPTALIFVGMIATTSVVVTMLRNFLRTERDHAVGLSLIDSLTGAANRRGMVERVPALSDLADRTGQKLACLVLDIDHFKQINDRYGHAHGDRVLVDVAEAVGSVTRRSDVLVRLGGEEFALFVIVPGPDELRMLSEKLRAAVARVPGAVVSGAVVTDAEVDGTVAADAQDSVAAGTVAAGAQVAGAEVSGARVSIVEDPGAEDSTAEAILAEPLMATAVLTASPSTAAQPAVTVSIGGTLGSGATPEAVAELLDAADAAMYRAKQAGRDRFILSA